MKRIEIGPITAQQFDKVISTSQIRKVVMDGQKMRVLPYSEWARFSWEKIRMLLHETATYVVPTKELIDYLAGLIVGVKAIEICAGNGYIGSNLASAIGYPLDDIAEMNREKIEGRVRRGTLHGSGDER